MVNITYSVTGIFTHPELGIGFDRFGKPSDESKVVLSNTREIELTRESLLKFIKTVTGSESPKIEQTSNSTFKVETFDVYNRDELCTYPYTPENYDPDYEILCSKTTFAVDPEVMGQIMALLYVSPHIMKEEEAND